MVINKSIISDGSGNDIRVSSVINYENEANFKSFSAKYVLSGEEFYYLNQKKYEISSGQYVVGNCYTEGSIRIAGKIPVTGICIDISKEKITEIIDFNFRENASFKKFIFEQEWMVQKYEASHTHLGYAINQIALKFDNLCAGTSCFNNEIFYSIAESIVTDQHTIFKQFQSLKSVKEETNGRLFNFVYDAKNYIDSHYLEKINLEQIALASKLSHYHFIRLFKSVFGISPYQYILRKRLAFAKTLLLEGVDIIDITYQTGFSNPANFSKAFKLHYSKSPKNFLK